MTDNDRENENLIQMQKDFAELAKNFTLKTKDILEDIKDAAVQNHEWSREFHRLLLNEYSKYPQDKVYGFVYKNLKTGVRKIILVNSGIFEIAHAQGEQMLRDEGERTSDWLIEGYQSISIPLTKDNVIEKVDTQTNSQNKPIGVFINDLKLIREKFANTKEKTMISSLIKKIEKTYR
ncbi:MAG: hypothetical protein ACYDBV_12145 [Nitrospiria bacterium]